MVSSSNVQERRRECHRFCESSEICDSATGWSCRFAVVCLTLIEKIITIIIINDEVLFSYIKRIYIERIKNSTKKESSEKDKINVINK